jgi:hypothetical protein
VDDDAFYDAGIFLKAEYKLVFGVTAKGKFALNVKWLQQKIDDRKAKLQSSSGALQRGRSTSAAETLQPPQPQPRIKTEKMPPPLAGGSASAGTEASTAGTAAGEHARATADGAAGGAAQDGAAQGPVDVSTCIT